MIASVSYMELSICQRWAEEVIHYYVREYKRLPANASDAETAVYKAYEKGYMSHIGPWKFIEKYMDLIVDQIGFIVEVE